MGDLEKTRWVFYGIDEKRSNRSGGGSGARSGGGGRERVREGGSKWLKITQNRPKMGVTEHFEAILSHFEPFKPYFGPFSAYSEPF